MTWEYILVNYKKYVAVFLLLQSPSKAVLSSGLCEPYYVSIKSVVNAHVGPGKNYKISWKYVVKGLPVVVVAKYDHWRMILDPQGDKTWIHKNFLSRKRYVICAQNSPAQLVNNVFGNPVVVAIVKKNVVMALLDVREGFCFVEVIYAGKKYRGWIKKSSVFGAS